MIGRFLAIVAGLWLMASPAVLGYVDTTAESSDRIVGPVVAALSFVAVWGIGRALRWATLPIGVYCLVLPTVLGFPGDAVLSNLAAGAVFVGTAFWRGQVKERYGGGWMSLREEWPGLGGSSG